MNALTRYDSIGLMVQKHAITISRITFLVLIFLCFCFFTDLFYKMSTYAAPSYASDLPAHINSAIEGETYSLIGIITKAIFSTFQQDSAYLMFSFFVSLMVIFSIFSLYLLFIEMDKTTGRDTTNTDRVVFLGISLASILIVSVYLPGIIPHYYLQNFPLTCWHNDTFIAMRPFSILTLVFIIRIYNKIEEGLSGFELVLFSVTLLLSTWMKPNFFVGFAILLLILAIWCLMRKTNKTTTIKRFTILALCTVPSLICLIIENNLLFGNGDSSIIFAPLMLISHAIPNWGLAFPIFLLFPLVVLIYELIQRDVNNTGYKMVWLLWAIQCFIAFFFIESGPRMWDGNLGWGMTFGNGLLYACSYYVWYCRLKILLSNSGKRLLKKGKPLLYCIFGIVSIAYLVIVGTRYFMLIYTGAANYGI